MTSVVPNRIKSIWALAGVSIGHVHLKVANLEIPYDKEQGRL
jgi:catechol-2,3-dioxygenase